MSHHRFRKHPNLVKEMDIKRSNQVWVSDITYIGTRRKPCYLSLITDAYSKKIVGFGVSDTMCIRQVSGGESIENGTKTKKSIGPLFHY